MKGMKRVILLLVVLMMSGYVAAQERFYDQSISVRAGLNISKVKTHGMAYDAMGGFHAGGIYQHVLTPKIPLYIETGLLVSKKGYKIDGVNKSSAYYMETPLLLNYKFSAKRKFILYPSAGFYYAFGFAGNTHVGGYKIKSFGDEGIFERSDFGLRLGFSAEWRYIVASAGFDYSLFDVGKGDQAKHRCFFLSVGYNF